MPHRRARNLHWARNRAERAARLHTEFLASVSHEIRTPLTAVLGFSETLADPRTTEPEKREAISTIRRNGEHLLSLLNDLLDLSKIEAGKLEIEWTTCYPRQILSDVRDLLSLRAAGKSLTLVIELATPIPESIRSDPVRLKQALVNLADNAIRFTERGPVRIVAECCPRAEALTFHVTDQGIGLTCDEIAKLFKPFTQAEASISRRFGGTGLGLTITRRIAELLDGHVSVESTPGEGSTFSLTVSTGPLEGRPMVTTLVKGPSLCEESREANTWPRLEGRILVVEDAVDNRRLISTVLERAGAEVTNAEDGRLGVEAALRARDEGRPFEVIIMDMQMPVMDGYTATRKLREAQYPGQIIALTAHAMKGELERCLAAGCDHYLSKPIKPNTLTREVAARMERLPRPGVGAPTP